MACCVLVLGRLDLEMMYLWRELSPRIDLRVGLSLPRMGIGLDSLLGGGVVHQVGPGHRWRRVKGVGGRLRAVDPDAFWFAA